MLASPVRRLAQAAKEKTALSSIAALTVIRNPYKAKKVWPPNFSELSCQQQLRFEKKLKRRLRLAHEKPRWDKAIKLIQFWAIVATIISFLLFSEFEFWGQEYKPSREMRKYVITLFGLMDRDKQFENTLHSFPREESESQSNPGKVTSHAKTSRAALVNGPFGHGTLSLDARDDAIHVRLDDDAADNHLRECSMQRLKVEDEIDESERRFRRRGNDDEVERRVVAIGYERRHVTLLMRRRMRRARSSQQRRQGKKVARARWPVRDESEYFRYQPLLDIGLLHPYRQINHLTSTCQLSVELGQTRLTLAVKDQKGVDHGRNARDVIA
ncbi:hypothetical protein CP533_3182, partial [Ophiocordyceps camponoti-saundersi (nom. inval.)]